MNKMAEIKKKTYVSPLIRVYVTEPMSIMAGSPNTTTDVNDWKYGGSLGTCELD